MKVKYSAVLAQSVKTSTDRYNAQTARNRRKIEMSNKVVSLATFMNARRIK